MKVEGACHCGYVTFSAEVDPETTGVCHCTDCQALTGSAFRATVRADKGSFALTGGAPTVYVKKTAESGTHREHAFCPKCGTSIYATTMGPDPKAYSLRIGTLHPREQLVPKQQIWTRSRVPWLGELERVRSIEKQR
jgi:hypothetical protein